MRPTRRSGWPASRRRGQLVVEMILWAAILGFSAMVGILSVRFAVAHFFHDEVGVIAATSNLFTFDTASPYYCEKTTPNYNAIFGGLSDTTDPPATAPASPEGSGF